ncbi:DUF6705 family protein [Flavobacterium facile]|uniref:DUF6705 family protein n=1 Tax=Flavobacterium facile TaxID=2893174 RepID=UPI002E779DE2|nr:DUF6705 family protein [Flavobacterium sp. T-12]
MKIVKIIIIALLSIQCKAQTPIIDISQSRFGQPDGYYMKDINNLLNPFEGTYIYSNGTTSFKMILIKKVQQFNGRYYEDLIIGEYQYIENGIEKVNTLNQINTVYNDQRSHTIDGNLIIDNNFRIWKCPTCPPNEKRLKCSIMDISTNRYASITMRRTIETGQEVMKIKISQVMGVTLVEGQPAPLAFSLPQGEFTLIKQ